MHTAEDWLLVAGFFLLLAGIALIGLGLIRG
jgi:hypothetical protein